MKEIKAPNQYNLMPEDFSIFLAGSIEMGKAELWQERVVEELSDFNVYIFNPRRGDWNSSWEQSIANPQFREQVEWELQALEHADLIIFYFSPGTLSPITLLELGLHIRDNIFVCCPMGFWRKGNVDITMLRYGHPYRIFNHLDEMLGQIKNYISEEVK